MVPTPDAPLDPAEPGFLDARDRFWMERALEAARGAAEAGEVPIGALLVRDDEVLAVAANRTRTDCDPTAHAEILALRAAARAVGEPRLPGATLYTTVEPCFMCAGALIHARVARVVWGVRDPKFGGAVSLGSVLDDPRANHRAVWTEGVGADEARALLLDFFRPLREGLRERRKARD
ncbi:MAG: tRNA adenosine(34) deaminase TadA [Planctomycetota bacterium]